MVNVKIVSALVGACLKVLESD